MFLDGFRKFGARVKWENNHFRISAKKIKGAKIFFPKVTVTGTETMMMTAVLAQGETILENAAMEPEIPILAEFSEQMRRENNRRGNSNNKNQGSKKNRRREIEVDSGSD